MIQVERIDMEPFVMEDQYVDFHHPADGIAIQAANPPTATFNFDRDFGIGNDGFEISGWRWNGRHNRVSCGCLIGTGLRFDGLGWAHRLSW